MPEVVPETIASAPPGWIAGLPDTLKSNETFTKFKTVGDFANDYIAVSTKASELEAKVSNSIPKLKDGASDAERSQFYDALGRPKQPSDYKLQGEDKNAPEWTNFWKPVFHSAGLTQPQVDLVQGKFNEMTQKMVDAHNASRQTEITEAETKLKSEWGDKFDTNVELAKRVYQKLNLSEFDKDFDAGTGTTRFATLRFLMKVAAATGEDRSPQAVNGTTGKVTGNPFPKSNMQPART